MNDSDERLGSFGWIAAALVVVALLAGLSIALQRIVGQPHIDWHISPAYGFVGMALSWALLVVAGAITIFALAATWWTRRDTRRYEGHRGPTV
jgi:hypothetical protein